MASSNTMERVLYNVHQRISTIAIRKTSSRFRSLLEQVILVFTLSAFALLFISHVAFVYRGTAPKLLSNTSIASQCLLQFELSSTNVTHIVLAQHGNSSSSAFKLGQDECFPNNILFSYSEINGFLLLEQDVAWRHNISTQYIAISPQDAVCFGEPFLQAISHFLLGKDTIMINWFLSLETGYVYNPRTNQMLHLDKTKTLHHLSLFRLPFAMHQIYIKGGVVVTSIFLFFVTTTLVSFTLRTTQERMLEFTLQLHAHVRQERPLGLLVTTHVLESLVFVPIMLGMMFFLIEFYGGDSLLAILVMSIVWLAEVFAVVSLRSREGMHFFPRVFFLLFVVFHVYHFSCPFGFTYMALGVTVSFMVHSMWFFWSRYELPALAHGLVSVDRPRMNGRSGAFSPAPGGAHPLDRNDEHLIAPRNLAREFPSMSSLGRASQLSRPVSSTGLIYDDDDDDEGSYMYFMNGEVVVHRARSPGNREHSIRRNASSSSSLLRYDVSATLQSEESREDPMEELTPRMGSVQSRVDETQATLLETAPTFPIFP